MRILHVGKQRQLPVGTNPRGLRPHPLAFQAHDVGRQTVRPDADVMQTRPVLGRLFEVNDEGPRSAPVAVDSGSMPPPEPLRANVVARYEAAGVAYSMYDDGSIESDDGEMIRRFKTMADLKAHIAGAA